MKSKRKRYRWCAVPECHNTSIKTPNKLFVFVPQNKTIRDKWLKLAKRDATDILANTHLYFCEDHFDLPNDMENYMEYHLMGSVSQIRMRPGCMPTKYQCQSHSRKRKSDIQHRPNILKKQRQTLIEECMKEFEENTATTQQLELDKTSGSSVSQANIVNISQVDMISNEDITTQVHLIHSDTATSYTPSLMYMESSTSRISEQMKSDSDCIELIDDDKKQQASNIIDDTLSKIIENPCFHIGVPEYSYYIIDIIKDVTSIPANHILMCFKKIRLNNTFLDLADEFALSPSYASKIFKKYIPIIARLMRPFIVQLNKDSIKKKIPIAFTHKYHNVSTIMYCLEIVVQKPSALNPSLKSKTMKYLVACTPNGLVSYISPGYEGQITDTCLVESCDFVNYLQSGMCVMADRGFKRVDNYLRNQGIKFVRPPSVTTGPKLSKSDAIETETLRIHVEKVLGRIHEFNMLNPKSYINEHLVKVLDDVITVACGLLNLQELLIK